MRKEEGIKKYTVALLVLTLLLVLSLTGCKGVSVGKALSTGDTDSDGIPAYLDNCPLVNNSNQLDSDFENNYRVSEDLIDLSYLSSASLPSVAVDFWSGIGDVYVAVNSPNRAIYQYDHSGKTFIDNTIIEGATPAINDIVVDNYGVVWVAAGNTIVKHLPGQTEFITLSTLPGGVSMGTVTGLGMVGYGANHYIVAVDNIGHIFRYGSGINSRTNECLTLKPTNVWSWSDTTPCSSYVPIKVDVAGDSQGNFYFLTQAPYHLILKYSLTGTTTVSYIKQLALTSESSTSLNKITVNLKGNTLFATDTGKGKIYVVNSGLSTQRFAGISLNQISGIATDTYGNLLVTSLGNKKVLKVHGTDGYGDVCDNCPFNFNADQQDADGDGMGDVCDLLCPNDATNDADGDMVCGLVDNCPSLLNVDQTNTDGDSQGDACDTDDDNDGVLDDTPDNCPLVKNGALNTDKCAFNGQAGAVFLCNQGDTDLDGLGNACDSDDDDDTVLDANDNCPIDPNANQANYDADAQGDVCDSDDDNDNVIDSKDCASKDSTKFQKTYPDVDGDGIRDSTYYDSLNGCKGTDIGSGRTTALNGPDNCPLVSNSNQLNTDNDVYVATNSATGGDACDTDDDGDNLVDGTDNCPLVANSLQEDNDVDGIGDACDGDNDGDGVADATDNCPLVANSQDLNSDGVLENGPDTDADGAGDACDTDDDGDNFLDADDFCPLLSSIDNINTDGDGQGDACDTDDDADTVLDVNDNCPIAFGISSDQTNTDSDGMGDVCDADDDGDSFPDTEDLCPLLNNPDNTDTDADGAGNVCDADDDNDGVSDSAEPTTSLDSNSCGDSDTDTCDDCSVAGIKDTSNDGDDSDGDSRCDAGDLCPADSFNDADMDGVCAGNSLSGTPITSNDNCPNVNNPDQTDTDGDVQGDACDDDDDGDGVADAEDCSGGNAVCSGSTPICSVSTSMCVVCTDDTHCISGEVCDTARNVCQLSALDTDNDGTPDTTDSDDDGDTVADESDNCPLIANFNQDDTNGDGEGDACEPPAAPPVARATFRYLGNLGVSVDASTSTDAQDCPNGYQQDSPIPCILRYDWNFGAGDIDQRVFWTPTSSFFYSAPGTYQIILRVYDYEYLEGAADVEQHSSTFTFSVIVTDVDTDGDGATDDRDSCPTLADYYQTYPIDTNDDGIGDACLVNDSDGDGTPDATDTDDDGDGVCDPGQTGSCTGSDNCPLIANPNQADEDNDGIGTNCDTCHDVDGDGFGYDTVGSGFGSSGCSLQKKDVPDGCPTVAASETTNGCPVIGADTDYDGVSDQTDTCPSYGGTVDATGCPVNTAGESMLVTTQQNLVEQNLGGLTWSTSSYGVGVCGNDAYTALYGSTSTFAQVLQFSDESQMSGCPYGSTWEGGTSSEVIISGRTCALDYNAVYNEYSWTSGLIRVVLRNVDPVINSELFMAYLDKYPLVDTDGDGVGDACEEPEPEDPYLIFIQEVESALTELPASTANSTLKDKIKFLANIGRALNELFDNTRNG